MLRGSKILRSIIDIKAIATSGRAAVRSGVATVFEHEVSNAVARILPVHRIGTSKAHVVVVRTTQLATVIAKAGIPASIYGEKDAKIVTDSSVHITSRLLTVISGKASAKIIAAAYPQGYVTRARGGDPSYIHTTRYS